MGICQTDARFPQQAAVALGRVMAPRRNPRFAPFALHSRGRRRGGDEGNEVAVRLPRGDDPSVALANSRRNESFFQQRADLLRNAARINSIRDAVLLSARWKCPQHREVPTGLRIDDQYLRADEVGLGKRSKRHRFATVRLERPWMLHAVVAPDALNRQGRRNWKRASGSLMRGYTHSALAEEQELLKPNGTALIDEGHRIVAARCACLPDHQERDQLDHAARNLLILSATPCCITTPTACANKSADPENYSADDSILKERTAKRANRASIIDLSSRVPALVNCMRQLAALLTDDTRVRNSSPNWPSGRHSKATAELHLTSARQPDSCRISASAAAGSPESNAIRPGLQENLEVEPDEGPMGFWTALKIGDEDSERIEAAINFAKRRQRYPPRIGIAASGEAQRAVPENSEHKARTRRKIPGN